MLAPFDRPVYLTRSWCLFEFLVAMKLGLAMDMVLAPVEEERLVAFLTTRGDFLELFSRIDFGAAEASVAEDRERIRERVVAELGAEGFRVLNERVMERMRLWLAEVARARHDGMGKEERAGSEFQRHLGDMMVEMGRYKEAEEVLEECVAGGNNDAFLSLGCLFQRQGKGAEALEAHKKDLNYGIGLGGPWHIYVAGTFSNIGLVYMDTLGMHQEALAMYDKALDIGIKGTGEADWSFLFNKGLCLCRLRRYSEAMPVLRQSHDAVLMQLGPAHVACHIVKVWMGNTER